VIVSVADEYTRRLGLREARVAALEKKHARLGTARLSVAALTILAAVWSLALHPFRAVWLLAGVAVFAALVLFHYRVCRFRSVAARGASFYRGGLARLADRWQGAGQPGSRFEDPHHVYSADLDLFGRGSLFELLCTARTRMGEERLARWLLSGASVEAIRERQASIVELRDRLDLREDLAVLGEHSSAGVHPSALLEWAETPAGLGAGWVLAASWLLPILAVSGALYWGFTGVGSPFFAVLLIEAGILYGLGKVVDGILHGSENAFDDLRLFGELLTRLERERFESTFLRSVLERLASHSLPASRALARLSTIANFAGSRRNQLMALLAVPLMYNLQVALAAERWRRAHGAAVRTWIDAVADFEALASLAANSYEHPEDTFPEFVSGAAHFEADDLGHPLIPAARCVRNDVSITERTRILLVSGSNMSGKSTLLRTVGISTVLAMAGATVRARRLRLTELQVGASIRINDSLHEGSSRFYAEITRLRQVFELAVRGPALLVLLDELLQGTNSSDRRTGAQGIVRALAERGAIGLISTHDLALADITGLDSGTLRNVHFQDELRDGRMTFDFKLRDGVVTKSNAIELMRSIGLQV
jgi:hypothetical protein